MDRLAKIMACLRQKPGFRQVGLLRRDIGALHALHQHENIGRHQNRRRNQRDHDIRVLPHVIVEQGRNRDRNQRHRCGGDEDARPEAQTVADGDPQEKREKRHHARAAIGERIGEARNIADDGDRPPPGLVARMRPHPPPDDAGKR